MFAKKIAPILVYDIKLTLKFMQIRNIGIPILSEPDIDCGQFVLESGMVHFVYRELHPDIETCSFLKERCPNVCVALVCVIQTSPTI